MGVRDPGGYPPNFCEGVRDREAIPNFCVGVETRGDIPKFL